MVLRMPYDFLKSTHAIKKLNNLKSIYLLSPYVFR